MDGGRARWRGLRGLRPARATGGSRPPAASHELAVVTEQGRTGPGLSKADKKTTHLFHGNGVGERRKTRGAGEAERQRLATAARNARHPPAGKRWTKLNKTTKAGLSRG